MLIESVIIAAEVVFILALLVMLVRQQVKGQYMDKRRLWGTPAILAVVGAIYIPLTVHTFIAADAILATLDVIIAVGVGLGLAALTTTHVATNPDRRGRWILIRSGWKGGALWITFIAVRLGLQPGGIRPRRQAHQLHRRDPHPHCCRQGYDGDSRGPTPRARHHGSRPLVGFPRRVEPVTPHRREPHG